jgi:hypothetical protein
MPTDQSESECSSCNGRNLFVSYLPSIVESERYKQALDAGELPPDELLHAFKEISEVLSHA